MTRTKTDAYFNGIQGKRLVKIIPFNHPLSPTDLEQLKQELKARENDERDILLVCLGKELACETWLLGQIFDDDFLKIRRVLAHVKG